MEVKVKKLLEKLEELNLSGGYWNIDRKTGQYLFDLIIENKPKLIVEIGASNGYSTIWLAMAAKEVGAKVLTHEFVPEKVAELVSNLQKAGLIKYVQIVPDDANKRLEEIETPIDFVFLDGRKNEYLQQFKMIENKLSKKGIVTADNILSHPDVVKDYLKYVRNNDKFKSELIEIGTGLELTRKK